MTIRNRRGAIDFGSRRAFLRATSAGMALAPFIPLLEAQAQNRKQRLVIMTGANGVGDLNRWNPTGTGATYTLSSTLKSLEPYKQDLILFSDFEGRYTSDEAGVHPMAAANLLTATPATRPSGGTIYERQDATRATGPSVDQVIAKVIGKDTPFQSLQLGCCSDPTWAGDHLGGSVVYRAASDPIVCEVDVFKTYDRLFANFGNGAGSGGTVDLRRGDGRSILDRVKGDLEWLRGRVGAQDLRRLDAHLESIRDIEKRLRPESPDGTPMMPSSMACKAPTMPVRDNKQVFHTNLPTLYLPQIVKLNVDLMIAAMACDLTRVAVIQVSATTALFIPIFLQMRDLLHNISHNDYNSMTKYTEWSIREGFAYLLGRLKATQDGSDGTLLDNSAVVWTNEFGDGGRHRMSPMPIIAAGRAGGKWQTGRLIRFGRLRRHSDFLVSLCRTFGLDMTKFGTDPTGGPIAELGV